MARFAALNLFLVLLLPLTLVLQAIVAGPVFGSAAFGLAMLAFVLRWAVDIGAWANRAMRVSSGAPATPRR